MKILDKLKIKVNKNLVLFLVVLMIIGIASGSLFVSVISESDKSLIQEHLNLFLDNIGEFNCLNSFKNGLITDSILIMSIWLLGISIIGIIFIVIMFFGSSFILGFSIGSIILTYKAKGLLFSLIYVFPSNIIKLIFIMLLSMYALSFSLYLLFSLLKKKNIDLKIFINKYLIILFLTFICVVLMNLYDSYVMPNLIKLIIPFIK